MPARSRHRSHHPPGPARRAAQRPHRPGRTRSRARTGRLAPAAARSPAPARDRRRARPGRRPAPPSARSRGSRAAGRPSRPPPRTADCSRSHRMDPPDLRPSALAGSLLARARPSRSALRRAIASAAALSSTPSPVARGSSDSSASSRQPEPTPRSSRRSGRCAIGQLRKHRLDDRLGLGARDQDRRTDLEAQAPELLLAKEVGDRFTREAASYQRIQARLLCGAQRVPPAGHERGAFDPGRSGQQQPGLRARALDARRGEPRGNLSG